MTRHTDLGLGMPPVLRLGLATRGNTHPTSDDVLLALERGINYWNWCGHEDGMSQAVRELGTHRDRVVLATQIGVPDWSGDGMRGELDRLLTSLGTTWLDVVTLYYVECQQEWNQVTRPGGAMEALQDAQRDGIVRSIGLTTHQRRLAAKWVQTEMLDLVMIRYNAAHRGAESDVFPITDCLGLPVVCFTCLRWGALLEPTKQDPPANQIPLAPEWYRFVLSNPSVGVALMAPNSRAELLQNLALLDDWRELSAKRRGELAAHGDRVRESAGPFP